MNQNETGTHSDSAKNSHLRTEKYSNLLDEILASPAEFPSCLLTSEDFQLPAATSAFRTEERLADLEVKLTENQEKMSQTLKSMMNILTILSHAVSARQPPSAPLPTTHFRSELKPALLPKYDGNRQHGQAFINACQASSDSDPTSSRKNKLKSNDLISESGYTSPKTIVVKFRRGLDSKIGDAVATMAANRPDDLDPEGWYEAAVRIDQNQAMNVAFRDSIEAPDTTSHCIANRNFRMSYYNPNRNRMYSTSRA